MKKKLIAFALAGTLLVTPVVSFAEETDTASLEERVKSLENVVIMMYTVGKSKGYWDDLEAEYRDIIAAQNSSPETEASAPTDTYFEYDDCSLQYDTFEIRKDYRGNDMIVVYFYFTNNSDGTQMAMTTFNVQVFQNGKECGSAYISEHIQEYSDSIANIMPGSNPVRVAFLANLTDKSDVIVRVSPLISFGDEHLDIPIKLQ